MNPDAKPLQQFETMVTLVNIALKALSLRLISILLLMCNTGVFVWAMSHDSWLYIAGATIASATNWCLVYLKPPTGENHG